MRLLCIDAAWIIICAPCKAAAFSLSLLARDWCFQAESRPAQSDGGFANTDGAVDTNVSFWLQPAAFSAEGRLELAMVPSAVLVLIRCLRKQETDLDLAH